MHGKLFGQLFGRPPLSAWKVRQIIGRDSRAT